jgi:hypothetical protein
MIHKFWSLVCDMGWENTKNIAEVPEGSYRSIAGYAAESLVIGRAMLCGYIIFVKAWRDSKYDAVLDAHGSLYRIEIKGTAGDSDITTSSGGRSGQQISREVESREKPLSTEDCDWLIATTSMDSYCWIVPVEFIEILGLMKLTIRDIGLFREKWAIFNSTDSNIQPYLKSGYKDLTIQELERIAANLSVDYVSYQNPKNQIFSFDPQNKRLKKYELDYKSRLVIGIWEKIFNNISS